MDAVEYVKQCRRMIANDVQIRSVLGGWSAEAVVEQVEQWTKEHPVKTRQSEFLKQCPEAEMFEDGYLNICPALISKDYRDKGTEECYNVKLDCNVCKHDFWLKEI